MPIKGKRWIMKKHFDGSPKKSDLELQEFDIPELNDGDIMVEGVVHSVDPYMRPYMRHYKEGDTMIGEQVAKVIETKDSDFPVGTHVLCTPGWVTHYVAKAKNLTKVAEFPEGVSISYAIGGLGMPGLTAYFGLLRTGQLKEGETVFVNAAAGAVGSMVGQIAKIKGCRAIGSAGTDEKVKYLTEELGFDGAFNYKTVKDADATIKKLAPKGIDVFFENVGGEASTTIYNNMNLRGRVAICGGISDYNVAVPPKVTPLLFNILQKRLTVTGFIVHDNKSDFPTAMKDLIQWTKEGKLKFREKVHHGFDSMYDAFMDLFTGRNIGKVVVFAK